MKYVKLFESKLLDDILDKILSDGKESLTRWEKEFLSKHGTPEGDKMEQELNEKPSKDVDKYELLWIELDEYDKHNFIINHKIMPEFGNKKWNKLPDTVKAEFKKFVKENGIL